MLACAALALAPIVSASAAEHTLAGIRVFASFHDVIARYGNPNRIITDPAQFGAVTTSGAPGAAALGAQAGGMGMGMGMRGRMMMGNEFGGASGAPGSPDMATANPYAAPGAPGSDASGGTQTTSAAAGEVLYVYNRPGGVTYDFLLSPDGRVIQITVLGYKSASIKTGRGIQLGTLYSIMTGRYGYPEGQRTSNNILTADYLQRDHASFQLRDNHVVGITIAAIE